MKKIIITLVLCIVSSVCFGQISIKETKQIEEPEERVVFDSTKNFLGMFSVESYQGQVLFVRPKESSSQANGYDNFKKWPYDISKFSAYQVHYGHDAESSHFNTNYWDLAYKYFIVDSVVKLRGGYEYGKYILYLTERDNIENKCCFVYDPKMKYDFPFLVVSHYNFIINNYVNKEFMTVRNDKLSVSRVTDISMNEDGNLQCELVIGKDTIYLMDMNLYFKRNKEDARWIELNGEKHLFFARTDWENKNKFIEKAEWNKLVNLYGVEMMKCVLTGSLRIGMPVALMYLSWGEPDEIHSSSYGVTQYIYMDDYVYVKNGRITSWHD